MEITEVETKSVNGTEAVSPQNLTKPVDSSLFQTPTMSFGDVGYTGAQRTTGIPRMAHGVGHFEKTKLLERMALIDELTWSLSSPPSLYNADIINALYLIPRNKAILDQFEFYRTNVEVTIRMNTNQFYYGCLLISMWTSGSTGSTPDRRAVLDPTLLSASSAESVVKKWEWSFPSPWHLVSLIGGTTFDSVPLSIDVAAPLLTANDNMPSSITVQIWARFTDIELSFPTGPFVPLSVKGKDKISMQSSAPKVKYIKKSPSNHPAQKPPSTLDDAISAIESVTIGDAVVGVKSLASFVSDNWGSFANVLGFILDKPDFIGHQTPVTIEGSQDMFCTDIDDTNVSLSVYKNRYVDPGPTRLPMTKNWTISDYARIPGLRSPVYAFTAEDQSFKIPLILAHPNGLDYKIPLDYSWLSAKQWRGSVKVCLAFFTSAFISARFVIQYTSTKFTAPTVYDAGLSRIINVKGDVIDTFTLPWLSSKWWLPSVLDGQGMAAVVPQITVTCDSAIANTDTALSPTIYMLVWVSGGDDIQFAYPQTIGPDLWSDNVTMQSAPGEIFSKTFPPIGEDTFYDIDRGYCTSEVLGPISDIVKRYSWLIPNTGYSSTNFWANTLDQEDSALVNWQLYAFRQTLFGSWRAAFLFRSGGYRYRAFLGQDHTSAFSIGYGSTNIPFLGTNYVPGYDGIARLTVPQTTDTPFSILGDDTLNLNVINASSTALNAVVTPVFIAARDDVQFGYPVLPLGISIPS
jgi:hypothetical protein